MYGYPSPKISAVELNYIGILVDEVVSTVLPDSSKTVSFIHAIKRVSEESMRNALDNVNINGFENLIYTIHNEDVILEKHPYFRMLMIHESTGNPSFHTWFQAGRVINSGYKLLKKKALNNGSINKGIYVLQMDGRPKPFFYVGKAEDIERRIQQHRDGTGAFCISGEAFTRVETTTKGTVDDMESWERNEVLARMFEFGINNVRGWMYTFKTMPVQQKVSAFDQICEKFDRCRKCGRGTHFVSNCQAMSADIWTCGMELRPAYNVLSTDKQTELDEAVAECRVTEAALVEEREERRIAMAALADAGLRIAEATRALGGLH